MLRRILGNRGERAAARFLKKSGMRILAWQFNTRWGEIDLIAIDGDTIVFVEVKTRRSQVDERPAEAVDFNKQKNMTQAALFFLKQKKLLEYRARFDVVSVVWPDDAKQPLIEHEKSAFEAVDLGNLF